MGPTINPSPEAVAIRPKSTDRSDRDTRSEMYAFTPLLEWRTRPVMTRLKNRT